MRLIDADALLERTAELEAVALEQVEKYEPLDNPSEWRTWSAILTERSAFKFDLMDAPIIETEPIRHGHWIIKDNPDTEWYQITCSECGEDVTSTALCIGVFPNARVLWDYCPYCGAYMGVEDETD